MFLFENSLLVLPVVGDRTDMHGFSVLQTEDRNQVRWQRHLVVVHINIAKYADFLDVAALTHVPERQHSSQRLTCSARAERHCGISCSAAGVHHLLPSLGEQPLSQRAPAVEAELPLIADTMLMQRLSTHHVQTVPVLSMVDQHSESAFYRRARSSTTS